LEEYLLPHHVARKFRLELAQLWRLVDCFSVRTAREGDQKTVNIKDLEKLEAERKLDEFRAIKVRKAEPPLTERDQIRLEMEHQQAKARAGKEPTIRQITTDTEDGPSDYIKLRSDLSMMDIDEVQIDPQTLIHPALRKDEKPTKKIDPRFMFGEEDSD
jgi:hypothetical protein